MNKIGLAIYKLLYCFAMAYIIVSEIEALGSQNQQAGFYQSSSTAREVVLYSMLVSFALNGIMYFLDTKSRNYYLFVFGFSLIFINYSLFPIAGLILMVLGLIFEFILQLMEKR